MKLLIKSVLLCMAISTTACAHGYYYNNNFGNHALNGLAIGLGAGIGFNIGAQVFAPPVYYPRYIPPQYYAPPVYIYTPPRCYFSGYNSYGQPHYLCGQ